MGLSHAGSLESSNKHLLQVQGAVHAEAVVTQVLHMHHSGHIITALSLSDLSAARAAFAADAEAMAEYAVARCAASAAARDAWLADAARALPGGIPTWITRAAS